MEYNTTPKTIDHALEQRYRQADVDARKIATALASIPPNDISRSNVYDAIREITRIKYLLDQKDMATDHFNGLGELSIAKALGKDRSAIAGIDLEAKCNGTSSVMTKKILLIMFVNNVLDICIDPRTSAEITDIGHLSEIVFHALKDKHDGLSL